MLPLLIKINYYSKEWVFTQWKNIVSIKHFGIRYILSLISPLVAKIIVTDKSITDKKVSLIKNV